MWIITYTHSASALTHSHSLTAAKLTVYSASCQCRLHIYVDELLLYTIDVLGEWSNSSKRNFGGHILATHGYYTSILYRVVSIAMTNNFLLWYWFKIDASNRSFRISLFCFVCVLVCSCSVIHNMFARTVYHIGDRLKLLLCAGEENLEWQEMGCWNSSSSIENRRQRLVNRNTIARFVFCFQQIGADGGGGGSGGGGSSIFMSHSVDHCCCHRTFQ